MLVIGKKNAFILGNYKKLLKERHQENSLP
jgi:hypothetical protein